MSRMVVQLNLHPGTMPMTHTLHSSLQLATTQSGRYEAGEGQASLLSVSCQALSMGAASSSSLLL